MEQKINYQYLKSLNPCADRLDNYLKYYTITEEFNWDTFLDLKDLSYSDKIWVAKRYLTTNQLVHFAILSAQSVQPIFEAGYPNNKSLQNLFSYLKDIPDFTKLTTKQRDEIWALRSKVRDAAYAAYAVYAAARQKQQDLNLTFLKVVVRI